MYLLRSTSENVWGAFFFFSHFFTYHKATSLNGMKIKIAILYIETRTFQVAANVYVLTSNKSLIQRQFFFYMHC